jgi:hypothetical protein
MLPPDQRPAKWAAAIEAGFEHLKKTKLLAAAFFAGPLDDFQESRLSSSANEEVFGPIEKKLSEASRLFEVMGLFVLVSTIKPSAEVAQNILRIIGTRLDEPIAEGDQLPVLHMCVRIAASTRSIALSENIIGRCVTAARNTNASGTITEMFSAAVEACGAESDASKHRIAVGETATKFAFATSRREDVENIHAILGVLEARDEKLIPQIARARAIAETKLKRSGVD